MSTTSTVHDVFLSYALTDKTAAERVSQQLAQMGLSVFDAHQIPADADLRDTVWEALALSEALVAVVSPQTTAAPSVLAEVGAAWAWDKPVYIALAGPATTRLPEFVKRYPVYPIDRLDDMGRAIQSNMQPLTEDDRDALIKAYLSVGVPTDHFLADPGAVRQLTQVFSSQSARRRSGEKLVQELMRMRKRGELPRLRKQAS